MKVMTNAHNKIPEGLLSKFGLITIMIVSLLWCSSAKANPCATESGFLDTGIGGTGQKVTTNINNNGIGGTGQKVTTNINNNGIGGTGHKVTSNDGIGGTGAPVVKDDLIYISGVISGFGSICVNGVEVEYDEDTPVTVDNVSKSSPAKLRIGQAVNVLAGHKAGKEAPHARSINVRFPVEGRITAVAEGGKEIRVAGKSVLVSAKYDNAQLKPGASVRVSGIAGRDGRVVATYIESGPPGLADKVDLKPAKIPHDVKHVSIQGYVDSVSNKGDVVVAGNHFAIGKSTDGIKTGEHIIISGERNQNGQIGVRLLSHERESFETRVDRHGSSSGKSDDDRGYRNEDRDDTHDSKDENSVRDDDRSGRSGNDDDDNSGRGNSRDGDRVERESGSDDKIEAPEKVDKVDNSGKNEKPEKIEKNDKVETVEKIEKIEKIEKVETLDKIDKIDRSGKDDRIEVERIDRSGSGSDDRPNRDDD